MPKQRRAAASRSMARPAAKKSSSKAPKALKLSKAREGVEALAQAEGLENVEANLKRVKPVRPAAAAAVTRQSPRRCRSQRSAARAASAPPGLLRGPGRLRDRRPRAAAPRLRGGRRQPARRHSALSRRTRARRARPALPAGLRARNRSAAIGPPDAVRVGLRRDRRVERRRRRGALGHLNRALERAPESDHAHYIMAVALVDKGDPSRAGASPPRNHAESR